VSVSQTSAAPPTKHFIERPGTWRWSQCWRDVFFAHWRVAVNALRPHLPGCLEIDTFQGTAWVSTVAFWLDVWHRWLPSFGICTNFLELNLRTYVRWQGEPGICFLSIHADNRVAVALARLMTPLPYVQACLSYRHLDQSRQFTCQAASDGKPKLAVDFSPKAAAFEPTCESIEEWLLDRYRAFVPDNRGRVHRMVARHPPWSVLPVHGSIQCNRLGEPWGLDLNRQPALAHFSARMPALIRPFEMLPDV